MPFLARPIITAAINLKKDHLKEIQQSIPNENDCELPAISNQSGPSSFVRPTWGPVKKSCNLNSWDGLEKKISCEKIKMREKVAHMRHQIQKMGEKKKRREQPAVKPVTRNVDPESSPVASKRRRLKKK